MRYFVTVFCGILLQYFAVFPYSFLRFLWHINKKNESKILNGIENLQ
ncbi:hypothetical protein HMPREF9444_00311 [Succinatimonas hippei YIT 12066]|uniref:Uncharacterized protein n=1 Tax=Succinatimonas hippei (strain DSM 22608 / JCM 16073 / KCTC 15190 / YIT 12066) TaxID=762983 RepID=E8LHZ7_SUCHY|nr:hypothetical protein HMPREF9444_00311 [Succinatimonas hippei YIT 12066]